MTENIPLFMVTGFLGSGKTTFLQHLATEYPERHMLFLVNEFADQGLDQLKLDTTGRPTQAVVGGSLFCECKAGDFIRVMREEVLREHRQRPLDAVIIETSGIADPKAIGTLMADHGLDQAFELRRIVTIVSPKRFPSLLENLPAIQAQVEASDEVILNKTDLADPATLVRVEALIRKHNTRAPIARTRYCRLPFDFIAGQHLTPEGAVSTAEANPYTTGAVTWPANRSIDEARQWLRSLPESILRVKGGIQTPEGFWSVEGTVDSLDILPEDKPGKRVLVLISHDEHAAELARITDAFQSPARS
jgi:G3E family GTPase